jgi:hypothetical protein
VDGVAPYWRFAYARPLGKMQNVEAGFFGMNANLEPARSAGPTDRYRDFGLDASWQRLGGDTTLAAYLSWTRERRTLDASFPLAASNLDDRLDSFRVNSTYVWKDRWGFTGALFRIHGTTDPLLYAPAPDVGSRTGSPDTAGYVLQADYTPFGQANSWHAPWVNLRLGVQYTGYTKFNGARTNYDGFGRNASDNNTAMVFAWTAF